MSENAAVSETSVVPPARTALVTGASRGIGRELARGLAAAGLDVGLLARDEVRLARTAGEIEAGGGRAVAVTADVTDAVAVRRAVSEVERALGPIDLLVNNAGRSDSEVPVWEAEPEQWWQVVETNVRGPFLLSHAVVPGMLARGGGRVVDLSSGAAVHDMALATGYNVSKTALMRLGGAMHEAGFDRGLRVFELAPGVVRTDMSTAMRAHAGRTEWTDPADVVELLLAIASGDLDDCSGCYLRTGADTPESLRAALAAGADLTERRLRVAYRP